MINALIALFFGFAPSFAGEVVGLADVAYSVDGTTAVIRFTSEPAERLYEALSVLVVFSTSDGILTKIGHDVTCRRAEDHSMPALGVIPHFLCEVNIQGSGLPLGNPLTMLPIGGFASARAGKGALRIVLKRRAAEKLQEYLAASHGAFDGAVACERKMLRVRRRSGLSIYKTRQTFCSLSFDSSGRL